MALLGKWFGFARDEIYDQAVRSYDHGDWEGAIERFETCLDGATDPSMIRLARFYLAESYAHLGRTFLRDANYVDAIRNLSAAIGIAPNYPDLYVVAARAYGRLGDSERRRQAISRALELNSRLADALLERGIQLYEEGRRDEGFSQIREAVESEPTFDNEAFREAMTWHENGQFDHAVAALNRIWIQESDSGTIHLRLAQNYHRERMFEHAAREYESAIADLGGYADLRCKYGQTLLELGRVEEAILQLKEALRLNSRYVDAHALLGLALIRARRSDQAVSELQAVLELDPDNALALREVQRLKSA